MTVRYTRAFRYGDKGSDVEGVGRALARSRTTGNTKLAAFVLLPRRVRRTWGTRKQNDLRRFKKAHGLVADSAYTEKAHAKLTPFFDAKARKLMAEYSKPEPVMDARWGRLLVAMQALSNNTAGYVYGAGHGTPLDRQDPNDPYDCSSSTSKVLRMAGMFPNEYAYVSGNFGSWGEPGKGSYFTVYYNSGHVWIRLHKSRWWRFDTSPQGDPRSPKSGPRLRYLPRFTMTFQARHWKGM